MGGKSWGEIFAACLFAAVVGAIVAGVALGMLVWVDASWQECRRIHPAWYCAAGALR